MKCQGTASNQNTTVTMGQVRVLELYPETNFLAMLWPLPPLGSTARNGLEPRKEPRYSSLLWLHTIARLCATNCSKSSKMDKSEFWNCIPKQISWPFSGRCRVTRSEMVGTEKRVTLQLTPLLCLQLYVLRCELLLAMVALATHSSCASPYSSDVAGPASDIL